MNATEKKYKTAFYIMAGLAAILFASLISLLLLQRLCVQRTDYYGNAPARVYTLPEEEETALRVNINTADKEELALLPGIGDNRAEAIIAYRNEYGGFAKPEDIRNVPGIA